MVQPSGMIFSSNTSNWPSYRAADDAANREKWTALLRILVERGNDMLVIEAFQLCSRQSERQQKTVQRKLSMQIFVLFSGFFDAQHETILEYYDRVIVRLLERQLSTINVDWLSCAEELGFRGRNRCAAVCALIFSTQNLPQFAKFSSSKLFALISKYCAIVLYSSTRIYSNLCSASPQLSTRKIRL